MLSGKASHGNVALLLGRPAVVFIYLKVFRTTGIVIQQNSAEDV